MTIAVLMAINERACDHVMTNGPGLKAKADGTETGERIVVRNGMNVTMSSAAERGDNLRLQQLRHQQRYSFLVIGVAYARTAAPASPYLGRSCWQCFVEAVNAGLKARLIGRSSAAREGASVAMYAVTLVMKPPVGNHLRHSWKKARVWRSSPYWGGMLRIRLREAARTGRSGKLDALHGALNLAVKPSASTGMMSTAAPRSVRGIFKPLHLGQVRVMG